MRKILFLGIWGLFSVSGYADSELRPFIDKVLNEVRPLYEPVAGSLSLELRVEFRLESPLVVASADRTESEYLVIIHGGLLRSPRLSADGFRFVLCHELGHLFAGAPRRNVPPEWDGPRADDGLSFLSAEGESDYYANAVCFRRLVENHSLQDHQKALEEGSPPQSLVQQCNQVWGAESSNSMICQRAALGGLNMLLLVKDFDISFDRKSDEEADETIRDFYPSRQCRLDTALAGALCRSDMSLVLDFYDAGRDTCSNQEGLRPRCWFKPTAE